MGTIYGTGVNVADLVAALKELKTDWNATLALIDADLGVSGTDYVELWAVPTIRIIDTEPGIAIDQESIVKRLKALVTSIAGVNAKLDAESLQYSDYASKYDVTDTSNYAGMYQGVLVKLLYTLKTNINAIQAYLVADTTAQTTTYASANPIGFAIDTSGC